ncbi:TetR/AcrR family transcriptional regulator [Nocardioides coralli]|uniref:TetR/AcrR family transcriptional regulator n=1 Tax=Nocardioides coralli TaxID=2872154 RepID=UPI001CA3C69F|nr:TetR/AcrR family transcriptional regulator [Nocardioides coralli]QZY28488.1 TetR/AcrR family transcriptional regulator [Nocardioides coralli]
MATPTARDKILEAAHDLVFEVGFTGTTVDAILAATGTSKGAFFHHFPTKGALGKALIERYAELDAAVLDQYMTRAEELTDDPAEQLLEFLRGFEADIEAGLITQPGCLFASYLYERIPEEAESDRVILAAIALWRGRILEKLEQAVAVRPPAVDVDLESLADHVWAVFEGGFILGRAVGDQIRLRDQLRQLRTYLTLLLGVEASAGESP